MQQRPLVVSWAPTEARRGDGGGGGFDAPPKQPSCSCLAPPIRSFRPLLGQRQRHVAPGPRRGSAGTSIG